ncbi:MAG: hypothetical protein ACD_43C00211G0001, partial [uncultured bacterium]
ATNTNAAGITNTAPTQIADEEFVVPTTETTPVETPAGEAFSQLTATITNASPYGYRRVRVIAILRNEQKQIVAIQQSVWNNVDSFVTLPIEVNWLRRYAFGTQTELIVQTDVWNEANLIYPGND